MKKNNAHNNDDCDTLTAPYRLPSSSPLMFRAKHGPSIDNIDSRLLPKPSPPLTTLVHTYVKCESPRLPTPSSRPPHPEMAQRSPPTLPPTLTTPRYQDSRPEPDPFHLFPLNLKLQLDGVVMEIPFIPNLILSSSSATIEKENRNQYGIFCSLFVSAWCTLCRLKPTWWFICIITGNLEYTLKGVYLLCLFTLFFVYAYYLSIYKYRFRIASNVYVFIATQFVTVFFRGKFSVKEHHFFFTSPIWCRDTQTSAPEYQTISSLR